MKHHPRNALLATALLVGLNHAHADGHEAPAWIGGMAYGGEATMFPDQPATGGLSRDDVVAELQEWRRAGALEDSGEAGTTRVALERRMAMNTMATERHERMLAALERERMAAAAAAEAAATAAAQPAPADSATTAATTSPVAEPPTVSAAPTADVTTTSPTDTAAPTMPAPTEPTQPTAPSSTDTMVDTTRQPRPGEATEQPPVRQ